MQAKESVWFIDFSEIDLIFSGKRSIEFSIPKTRYKYEERNIPPKGGDSSEREFSLLNKRKCTRPIVW